MNDTLERFCGARVLYDAVNTAVERLQPAASAYSVQQSSTGVVHMTTHRFTSER